VKKSIKNRLIQTFKEFLNNIGSYLKMATILGLIIYGIYILDKGYLEGESQ